MVACGGPLARVDSAPSQQPAREPQVLVVTLQGKLGTQELARCTRALRKAESHGCSWVVFRFEDAGSQGEDTDDLQSLLDRIEQTKVGTVALVKGRVTHGAAQVAITCDRLYFLGKSEIGEITKPDREWWESEVDQANRFAALREATKARLDRREDKLSPDGQKLVLAMVDPSMQLFETTVREGGFERQRLLDTNELTALQGSGASVIAPEKLTRPLFVSPQKAEDYGLSNGALQGFDQLTEVLNVERDAMGELVTDWAEHMVGWLELLQSFLLVAGFVLILFEVKTPGVGLPGVLGVAFLGLAMFHSYLVGLAEVTEILLFFLGLAAIAVEIFVLPGMLIFGAIGFLSLVLALVLSRQSFVLPSNAIEEGLLLANLTNLTFLFVMVLVVGFLTWRLMPKIPWVNRIFLPAPVPATSGSGSGSGLGMPTEALALLVGRTGTAATALRPSGAMELGSDRLDVVTEGEFVEAGTPVQVLYVQGSRIVVGRVAGDERGGERGGEHGSVGVVLLLAMLGLGLLVAEVMFVSFGVIAIFAGVSLLSAVFLGFQQSTAFGVTMLVTEAILAPIVLGLAFKLLPKTRFGKQLILEGPTQSSTAQTEAELRIFLGRTGVTLSPLRPAGYARIDGRKVDVVTRGEMIDTNLPVKVIEVAGNRVVVART